jgi:hypothetical protein
MRAMIAAVSGKDRRWILSLVLAIALWIPTAASAQMEVRVQAAATDAFGGDYHALIGLDFAWDVGGGDCRPGEVCEVPNWIFLLAGYGGLVTDSNPMSAYGHIGAARKLTGQLNLGGVFFAFANPNQQGAAARLDAYDLVAFKVGYGWGDGEGMLVGIEIALEALRDLGR